MATARISFARRGSLVAEGRDTTTVVFPDAHLKIYLDASLAERARRRMVDLMQAGTHTNLQEQEEKIRRRDEFDSNRNHSPLRRADDAILVDTTGLSIEEQVEHIIELLMATVEQT